MAGWIQIEYNHQISGEKKRQTCDDSTPDTAAIFSVVCNDISNKKKELKVRRRTLIGGFERRMGKEEESV